MKTRFRNPNPISKTVPAEIFKWKDRHDVFKTPQEMDTHHLYFTLRMIWNHSAPPDMRMHPYEQYSFGPFYTFEYMSEAVKHIYRELKTRTDMEPAWIKGLVHIRKCIEGPKVTRFQRIGNSVSEEGSA